MADATRIVKFPVFRCGITNVGNTCFINSALQCLARIRKFAYYFEKGGFRHNPSWDDQKDHLKNMCTEWEDLASALRSTDTLNIRPHKFYELFQRATIEENMPWLNEGQNDSHEFMMFFINTLHKAVSVNVSTIVTDDIPFTRYVGKDSTGIFKKGTKDIVPRLNEMSEANWALHFAKEFHPILTPMFHGQLMSIIASSETGEQSFSFEPFSSIDIAVPNISVKGITIQDCLDKHFATEELKGDEQWESPTAGKVDASRASRIWRLPDVLILSLKRFTMTGQKIHTNIAYPLENLDMKRYIIGPEINHHNSEYDLIGIILHSGLLFGGHYVSIVRNPGGKWMLCNDSSVRAIDDVESIKNIPDAYALIYQKKHIVSKDDTLERISE